MKRAVGLLGAVVITATPATSAPEGYPVVRPGRVFAFPSDHGAHPAFRTEWWYVTGSLRTIGAAPRPLGFQITFFRTTPRGDAGDGRPDRRNPSRFAASQILFAHAALSDPAVGHLLHGERAARAGFGLAGARIGDTDVAIRNWVLRRRPDGHFEARVATGDYTLSLDLAPTQPVLLEGDHGYSRKGPRPAQASYYYSVPQLGVTGRLVEGGRAAAVTGRAWLDREWSSDYLGSDAVGWDWTGLNLDDGAALMAFRIRGADGRALWAGGSLRRADGQTMRLAPADVGFTPLAVWRSPRTGATYPVTQLLAIRLPEGVRRYRLTPLFADQELDARPGGMPVYWEGAVRTGGGSGYLELTGYAGRLRM